MISDLEKEILNLITDEHPEILLLQEQEIQQIIQNTKIPLLNYLYHGENLQEITTKNNLILKRKNELEINLTTNIKATRRIKKIQNQNAKKILEKKQIKTDGFLDVEYFEELSGAKELLKSYNQPTLTLLEDFNVRQFRQQNLNQTPTKPKSNIKTNQAQTNYTEEIDLKIIEKTTEKGIIDKKEFSTIQDTEKVHLIFAYQKKQNNTLLIPIYIGIGANYPYTRKLTTKNQGDNRFYRYNPILGFEQEFQEQPNNSFKNTINKIDPNKKKLLEGNQLLQQKLQQAASKYAKYFQEHHNIQQKMKEFEQITNKEIPLQEQLLNINCQIPPSIRAKTAILYAYLDTLNQNEIKKYTD